MSNVFLGLCVMLWYVLKVEETHLVFSSCVCALYVLLRWRCVWVAQKKSKDGFLWMFTTCTWNMCCAVVFLDRTLDAYGRSNGQVSLFYGQMNPIFHFSYGERL